MYVRYIRVRRHRRRVAVGSPIAVVDDVLTRPHGEVTYCRPSALRAGGRPPLPLAVCGALVSLGGGLGWAAWCRLKEDCEG